MSFSNKCKTFEAAIRYSDADQSKTLKAWQERAIVTRNALMQIIAEHKKEVENLAETYSQKEYERRVAPLQEEIKEITKIAKKRCVDDFNAVMAAKRKQLDKCLDAPSEESVRLLNVLNMRSDLTQAEITFAAGKLNNNIHSLRLLRDIANRNGLYSPDVGNIESIEANMANAEDYVMQMIESIGKEDVTEKLNEYAFWTHPNTRQMKYFSDILDGDYFTTAQMGSNEAIVKDAENTPKDSSKKPNAAKVYLMGDESLAQISFQFNVDSSEIRKANPKYDFSTPFATGDSIIVPSGRFKITNQEGSIIPDQVLPAYYDPSASAPTYSTGSDVDVATL